MCTFVATLSNAMAASRNSGCAHACRDCPLLVHAPITARVLGSHVRGAAGPRTVLQVYLRVLLMVVPPARNTGRNTHLRTILGHHHFTTPRRYHGYRR